MKNKTNTQEKNKCEPKSDFYLIQNFLLQAE